MFRHSVDRMPVTLQASPAEMTTYQDAIQGCAHSCRSKKPWVHHTVNTTKCTTLAASDNQYRVIYQTMAACHPQK